MPGDLPVSITDQLIGVIFKLFILNELREMRDGNEAPVKGRGRGVVNIFAVSSRAGGRRARPVEMFRS